MLSTKFVADAADTPSWRPADAPKCQETSLETSLDLALLQQGVPKLRRDTYGNQMLNLNYEQFYILF